MKLGFSIYADVLLAKSLSDHDSPWQASFGTSSEILGLLKSNGFTSIGMKLPANCPILRLKRILEQPFPLVLNFLFMHPEASDTRIIWPYLPATSPISPRWFIHTVQTSGFVVHGLSCYHLSKGKALSPTVHFLQELLEATAGLDIDFAVELLRDVPLNGKVRRGTNFSEILQIGNTINNRHFGIYWDFGHSFFQSERGIQRPLPPTEFLQKTSHTHTHS